MLHRILLTLVIAALYSGTCMSQGVQVIDHCPMTDLKTQMQESLPPYKTQYSKNYRITIKEYDQMRDFELKLMHKDPYRLVFNTTGMPQPIKIMVMDGPMDGKKSEVLYEEVGNSHYVFDLESEEENPSRANSLFVYVLIKAVSDVQKDVVEKGCVNFTYGVRDMHWDY